MICIKHNSEGAEILLDYCAGTLDEPRATELGKHIRECAECRSLIETQQAVWNKLDAWKPVEVSEDFDTRLYARIAREDAEPVWRQWWRKLAQPAAPGRLWRPLVPVAAAAAVLSLALMIAGPDADAPPPGPAAEKAVKTQIEQHQIEQRQVEQHVDADQVEQALDDLNLLIPVGS